MPALRSILRIRVIITKPSLWAFSCSTRETLSHILHRFKAPSLLQTLFVSHASFHLINVPLAKCDYLVLSRNATHYVYGIPPSTPFRVITRQCWDVSCIPVHRAAFVYPLRLTECFYTRASRRLPVSRRWMFRESACPSSPL